MRPTRLGIGTALLVALLAAVAPAASAATYPTGFAERTLVEGLDSPVGVAWTPDGRMLVIEQAGKLKVVAPGGSDATTILDISSRVNSFGDRGLLGLAVDSDFASNGYIYLLYTVDVLPLTPDSNSPMVSRLGRFVLGPGNGLGPETVLLGSHGSGQCPAPSNSLDCIPSDDISHSIGTVRSAPDGTLYVGSGDGASFSVVDPLAFRSYNEQSMAGKILHVDRNGRGLPGHSFCPANNDLDAVCTKVHAKGFRNPYRFKLAADGRLTVGDVGWTRVEEVDLVGTAGKSYGWPCYEGSNRRAGYRDRPECPPEYAKEGTADAHVAPDHEYPHAGDNAVIGGPTYEGTAYPATYRGTIFFGDYAGGFVRRLTLDGQGRVAGVEPFTDDLWGAVDLELAPGTGNLVYVQFGIGEPGTGSVHEVMYTAGNTAPTAEATATPDAGLAPLTVDFSSAGSGDPDGDALAYDWDFGDGTSHSTEQNPSHVYETAGTYTARLTVSDGGGLSATDSVEITVGDEPPTPTISAPTDGSTYRDGQTIPLSGTATDPQEGTLPDAALRWNVRLHHGDHIHPLVDIPGDSESPRFTTLDDHDADAFYEITLTARDSRGLTGSATAVIRPETVPFALESEPSGAPLVYGGETGTAPFTRQSAIGYRTTVSAASEFTRDGRVYRFASWSDGGARSHDVTIPDTASTLTATYTDAGAAGLVAAFGFDEASGASALDASGRGNEGAISGAARTTTAKFGRALAFDGVDDWVTVADAASLDLSGAMTLEAWVRPTALAGWRTALFKETSNDLAYALYAASEGLASAPSGWIGASSVSGPQPLTQDSWTHLATTYDGTTWRLFVNGSQAAGRLFSGLIPQSTGPLRIGGNAVRSEWFQGQIDEVRIYDRALTATEIATDKDTPVAGGAPPPPDLTPPAVSVTAPADGATVSGSVSVRADASDDGGVAGVQFKLDGANLGSEDTTAPFSVAWDTTSAAPGSHTLTAVARDASGNTATSPAVGVDVDDTQPTVPAPKVAIHVSELTQALEDMPAVPPTPTGGEASGKQWWYTSWHYATMHESLKEALRSDGTPFVEVSDAQIAAGELRRPDGSPKYPILISLAAEAVADNEIQPLRDYVNAGGFLFAGSSSFTRTPAGLTRGDFALANDMGLHMVNGTLHNWGLNTSFTKNGNSRLLSHIPSGKVTWRMPETSEQVPWGAPGCCPHTGHHVWQVRATDAKVLATSRRGPLIATRAAGAGRYIYHGGFQPLIGHGGSDPGMYAYTIFRSAIEWAFETAGVPIVKTSPWEYQYDAAFVARHDFEADPELISEVEASAQAEQEVGVRGDYFFCTGVIRIGSEDVRLSDAQKQEVIDSLRRAVSETGATIGSHNGGLKHALGTFTTSDYNYWHWGPDEVLDASPAGYANGRAYAKDSLETSFEDIEGWLEGLDNGRASCGVFDNCPRVWAAPFFNSTREASYQIVDELGAITSGEQKISPFPHYTLSTQTAGKRYPQVTLPVSDWFVGSDIAQSMEGHSHATVRDAVDFYYGLGALINVYSHESSAAGVPHTYINHAASKPRLWKTNAVGIHDWWQDRSHVSVTPSFSSTGATSRAVATISGATDPDTAIEIVIPGTTTGLSASGLDVMLDGQPAPAGSFRVTNTGAVKVKVGTTVQHVEVSYATPPKLQEWSQTDWSGGAGQSEWINETKFASSTGIDAQTPGQLRLTTASGGDALFADDFTREAPPPPPPPPPPKPFTVAQGGAWTLPAGGASPNRGTFDTTGGVLTTATSSPNFYGFAYAAGADLTDGSVEADIRVDGAFGGGIAGRINPSTGARYGAWLYGDGKLRLMRFSNWGTWNTPGYATVNVGPPGAATHHLKLTFTGTLLKVFYDGTERISFDVASRSDTDFTSGKAGLDFYATPGTAGPVYDDYVVKDGAGNVVFSDDFGETAVPPDTLAPWSKVLGNWSIAGGVIEATSQQDQYALAHRGASWSDYSIEGRFQLKAGAYAAGIGGRVNAANGVRYGAWVYPEGSPGGPNLLKLIKFSGWTTWGRQPMASVYLPSVGTAWHTLRLAVDGNRVRVSYDGDELIDVTDSGFDGSAPFTSGGVSLETWSATQAVTWDDLVVRTPVTYGSQGELVSSAFDGGAGVDWRSIAWDAFAPGSTGVCVSTRTADDAGGLASAGWSDCAAAGEALISSPDRRWLQYRVELSSSSSSSTPVVHELRVAYRRAQQPPP